MDGKSIRVDCIEPGIVRAGFQDHVDVKGAIDWLMGSKTQREWLEAEDVAKAIALTGGAAEAREPPAGAH